MDDDEEDEQDEQEERFLRTRTTSDVSNLVSQIMQGRATRLETSESEHSSFAKEVPVFCHNVAAMWTALKSQVGSSLKQKPPGKVRALYFEPLTPVSQMEPLMVPVTPFLTQRPLDLSNSLKGTDSDMDEPGGLPPAKSVGRDLLVQGTQVSLRLHSGIGQPKPNGCRML